MGITGTTQAARDARLTRDGRIFVPAGGNLRQAGAWGGALALVVAAAGSASATAAATTVPLPLSPGAEDLSSFVIPAENLPGLELTDVIGTDAYTAAPVDPAGEVRVSLPEGLEVPDPSGVTLEMRDIDFPEPGGGEVLTFTADGSSALTAEVSDGVLTVVVPPEEDLRLDEESEGVLTFPTASDVPGYADETAFYVLDLGTDVEAPEVDLAPVLITTSVVEDVEVPAGGALELSLPDDSVLREAGVSTLQDVVVVLDDLGRDATPPAPVVDASEDSAVVSVDAATAPGEYRLAVLLPATADDGVPLAQRAAATSVLLGVTAAPEPVPSATATATATAAPVPTSTPGSPATNPGLRSNTGVEDASGAGRGPLLLGGGLALVAAAGATVLALRRRPGR